jgi:glycolate oxidase FAD binding subunit
MGLIANGRLGVSASPTQADALVHLVGHDHLITEGPALAAAAVDGLLPRFIVRPRSIEEASGVMAYAQTEGLAVTPRGAGTALGLGNRLARLDLVLDLAHLNHVIEYEPADVSITVETGMRLGDLGRMLGEHRQFLPLDPPAWAARTVGGVLATNASGPLRARYGSARDLLLGVRFVQADGTITRGGSKVVKSVSGYDVPKLMIGALGTLGVIVEATLRLHPAPEHARSWLASFRSLTAAQGALAAILDSTLQPARLEILSSGALAALGRAADAGLAVCFGGPEDVITAQGESLDRLAASAGGRLCAIPDEFWTAYAAVLGGTPGSAVRLRISCLSTSVSEAIARVETLAAQHGFQSVVGGSGAVGVLTAALAGTLNPRSWVERVIIPLRQQVATEGGSVVVERCAPALKDATDVWGPVDESALAVMRRIKDEFDPDRVLNPGRFVGGW